MVATPRATRSDLGLLMESLLRALRNQGWLVAVHNDYMQAGVFHTFWLFTKGGRCIKGEGVTDEMALNLVFDAADKIERKERAT